MRVFQQLFLARSPNPPHQSKSATATIDLQIKRWYQDNPVVEYAVILQMYMVWFVVSNSTTIAFTHTEQNLAQS